MPQKLKKINNTTYGASFSNRTKVEIGDRGNKHFVPSCMMSCFDDEVVLKVTYADRPYNILTDILLEFDEEENEYIAPDELDKLTLTEAEVYAPYEIGVWYDAGDLLEYNGGLFEVVQGHTSQEDWPPPEVPALYKVSTPQGVIAEWVQPLGAHDAYAINTKVSHNGKIWVTIIDANVWEPGVYGWEETDGRVDVECYCVDGIGEQNVSGFEFEIVLRDKPESNVIEMAIESEGLNFYYQPALTQEEIDEGTYRPENVVGSYAVYHATCGQMHKGQANAQKYQTGKAFHIYRPKVVDANGDWVWGELSIDAGILSITVDEQWLDNAVYPVRVDPTFGYVDENGDGIVGGTSAQIASDRMFAWAFSCPGSGESSSISIYCRNSDNSDSFKGRAFIYNNDNYYPNERKGYSGEVVIGNSSKWHNFNMVVSLSEALYWLGTIQMSAFSESFSFWYDSGDVNQQRDIAYSYGVPPEIFPTLATGRDRNGSIYCTYEASPVAPIPVPILTAAQENSNIRISWTYPAPVYGVRIDTTNDHPSTAVSYTDDAVGFSPMSGNDGTFQWGSWQDIWGRIGIRPCLFKEGAVNYYLDPSNFAKKEDGVTDADITSGTDGDVMIEFPKIYWKMERVGDYLDVKYSLAEHEGFQCLAHTRNDGEGSIRVRDKVYMSAYGGYVDENDKLRSLSGKTLAESFTHPAGTTYAQNNNGVGYEGYEMFPFYGQLMLQVLYTVWFKSLDSQTALGRGLVDAGAKVNSGGTNNKGMFYGSTDGEEQIKFCGVEDLWGNLLWWVDGLYSNSARKLWIATDKFEVVPYDNPSSPTDKSPRPDNWFEHGTGFASDIFGYITNVHGDTTTGFVMTQSGGSLSTYYCDNGALYASRLGYFGGDWYSGSYAGVFFLRVNYSGANAYSSTGSRSWFCQK